MTTTASMPANTTNNGAGQAVQPPSAIQPAADEESQRAQKNIEERERKLNNPFYKLFSKKTAGTKPNLARSYETGGGESSRIGQRDEMIVHTDGHAETAGEYDSTTIDLKDANAPSSKNLSNYRWAVVYENQRGITLFSIPLYGRCPLFPTDPPNYTLPSTGNPVTREHHPFVTLEEYSLPDASWRWVSNGWMIDMRGAASVQQDGFEYNWRFSKHGWRYRSGFMGAGSWVRRRRWMRLMVRYDAISPKPPKSADASARQIDLKDALNEVWQGNAGDWLRLRKAMRLLDIDGRKLEAWRMWLDCAPSQGQRLPSSDFDSIRPSLPTVFRRESSMELTAIVPASKGRIAAILHERGMDILSLFIYSECRTEFLRMLIEAGLIKELSSAISPQYVDFWKQLHSLEEYSREVDLHCRRRSSGL